MSSIYKFPPLDETVLSNGLRLILVADSEQDGLVAVVQFPIGTFSDPQGFEGTTELCASLMQKGCAEYNAEMFNEKMEYSGASVFSDIGEEHVALGVRMLASKENEIFPLFLKMLSDPKMDQHEFSRLQHEMLTTLKAEISEPAVIANRHFYRGLAGKDHPAGRFYSAKSVKRITLDTIRNFYQNYFSHANSIMVIAGNFDPEMLKKTYLSLLSKLPSSSSAQSIVASSVPLSPRTLKFVDKPNLTQSNIIIGHSAPGEVSPKKAELALANYILGGGTFFSRLMNKIRSSDGRTYGISSQIASERHFGAFLIQTTTQNSQVGVVIRSILDEFTNFCQNGIMEQELEVAKQYAVGNMAFQLEGITNIAEKLLWLRFYGRSNSYIENFDSMIEQVTVKGINEAIRSFFSPESAQIVVVGRKSEVIEQIKTFGPLSEYHFRDHF